MILAENAPQASTCTTVLFIDDNDEDQTLLNKYTHTAANWLLVVI